MPKLWSEDLYDPNTSTIKHPDIVALDVEHGKWFQCKWCKNPKDLAENKFVCRTPFSTEFPRSEGTLRGQVPQREQGHSREETSSEGTVCGCKLKRPNNKCSKGNGCDRTQPLTADAVQRLGLGCHPQGPAVASILQDLHVFRGGCQN